MVSKLGVVDNDIILEPSAGEGIFIDEVLETSKTVQIDALDINSDAISILKKKYEDNTAVVVRETDTLLDEQLDIYSMSQLWLKQTDTLFDQAIRYVQFLGRALHKSYWQSAIRSMARLREERCPQEKVCRTLCKRNILVVFVEMYLGFKNAW